MRAFGDLKHKTRLMTWKLSCLERSVKRLSEITFCIKHILACYSFFICLNFLPPPSRPRSRGPSAKDAALALALSFAAGAGLAHSPKEENSGSNYDNYPSFTNQEKPPDTRLLATEGSRFETQAAQVAELVERDLVTGLGSREASSEIIRTEDVRAKADHVVAETLLAARGHILTALREEFRAFYQKEGSSPSTDTLLSYERELSGAVSARIMQTFVYNPSTPLWHPLHREAIAAGFGAWLAVLAPKSLATQDKIVRSLSQTETTADGVTIERSASQPIVLDPEIDETAVREAQNNGDRRELPAPPGGGYTIPTTRSF